MPTKSFEQLIVWQKAQNFVKSVYLSTRTFPDFERFGLSSQFQRAAVSIAANIAEGYGRLGKNDKLHFLNYAQGGLEECRCYIILSCDLNYIDESQYQSLTQEIQGLSVFLNSYIKGIVNNTAIVDVQNYRPH